MNTPDYAAITLDINNSVLSPEDKRLALRCIEVFQDPSSSSNTTIDYCIYLENINRKYGTRIGMLNQK